MREGLVAIACGATLALLVAPGVALGAPAVNGLYTVSETPGQSVRGPDGNVWVVLGGVAKDLAKVTPAGVVTEYNPLDISGAVGITVGPDNKLWVTQANGVASFSPADPEGTAVKTTIPDITDPRGIVAGPDGNLWTASTDKIIKIPPATPSTFTTTTVTGMGARGVTRVGDGVIGRIWIADFAGGRIVRVDPAHPGAAGQTFYNVGGGPQQVQGGPGTQVAFANPGAAPQHVGRIAPGGTPMLTELPATDPFGIALAADGAYWFAQFAGNSLTRLTTGGVATTLKGFPSASGPRYLSANGHALFVSLETTKQIARVTGVDPPAPPVTPPPSKRVDRVPPRLSALGLSPSRLRGGDRATLRFTLSEAATVTLRIERALAGRRRGRACVRPTRALRRARRCTRYVRAGESRVSARAGTTRRRYTARVGRRALAPGHYRILVGARDAAGNRARSRTTTFTVLRPRRAKRHR